MARPQNRQVATAVRRQCQQSIARSLVESCPTDGGLRVQRAASERLSDQPVEPLATETVGAQGGHRPDGRGPGDVLEQGHLAEVGSGPERPYPVAVTDDFDLAGTDRVEGVARIPLTDDLPAGLEVHPLAMLQELGQLHGLQML